MGVVIKMIRINGAKQYLTDFRNAVRDGLTDYSSVALLDIESRDYLGENDRVRNLFTKIAERSIDNIVSIARSSMGINDKDSLYHFEKLKGEAKSIANRYDLNKKEISNRFRQVKKTYFLGAN